MSEKEKADLKETIVIIKQLDYNSLQLIKAGAEMLKARQKLEEKKVPQFA